MIRDRGWITFREVSTARNCYWYFQNKAGGISNTDFLQISIVHLTIIKQNNMKTLVGVFVIAITFVHAGYSQNVKEKDVPVVIKNSLVKNFSINRADWNKEGANYEASFKEKGNEMSVVFDGAGTVIETEKEIKHNELPQPVQNALNNDYKDYELEEIAKIDSKGATTFETELEKGKDSLEILFSGDGKVISKIEKKK